PSWAERHDDPIIVMEAALVASMRKDCRGNRVERQAPPAGSTGGDRLSRLLTGGRGANSGWRTVHSLYPAVRLAGRGNLLLGVWAVSRSGMSRDPLRR